MDYHQALALVIDQIDQLIEDPQFLSELAGEDESFIDMSRDFFSRLEDQFTPVNYVEDDPILWRHQQDEQIDWFVKSVRHPTRYKSAAVLPHTQNEHTVHSFWTAPDHDR